MPGTFYVPISRDTHPLLGQADLRSLHAEGFEIGGHGLTHRVIPDLAPDEQAAEVTTSKKRLEDVLGAEIRMFAYPKGRCNAKVVRHLIEAGYEGARTTRMLAHDLSFNPFEMPTTLQAYPHSPTIYVINAVKAGTANRVLEAVVRFPFLGDWVQLGKRLFDQVSREGGVWHLYGHSWEIDRLGLWPAVGDLLDYVARRERVLYLTNFQVLSLLRAESYMPGTEEEI
jgi:peptidoglycan/xylan/chitin deacetylase (PgdA/CDA1 family)